MRAVTTSVRPPAGSVEVGDGHVNEGLHFQWQKLAIRIHDPEFAVRQAIFRHRDAIESYRCTVRCGVTDLTLRGAAVEPCTINCGGSVMRNGGESGAFITSSSRRAACRPISRCWMRTVVSGGLSVSNSGMSLWPTREMSVGHWIVDSAKTS